MKGSELAVHLRSLLPGLPVLVVTVCASGDLELGLPQLAKPCRQFDLVRAIDQLVEA